MIMTLSKSQTGYLNRERADEESKDIAGDRDQTMIEREAKKLAAPSKNSPIKTTQAANKKYQSENVPPRRTSNL